MGWEPLGKVCVLFQMMTLASIAHCCHLSSTDSGTVQPAALQASSHSIMAVKSQGRLYSCAHWTEEEMSFPVVKYIAQGQEEEMVT